MNFPGSNHLTWHGEAWGLSFIAALQMPTGVTYLGRTIALGNGSSQDSYSQESPPFCYSDPVSQGVDAEDFYEPIFLGMSSGFSGSENCVACDAVQDEEDGPLILPSMSDVDLEYQRGQALVSAEYALMTHEERVLYLKKFQTDDSLLGRPGEGFKNP